MPEPLCSSDPPDLVQTSSYGVVVPVDLCLPAAADSFLASRPATGCPTGPNTCSIERLYE
jgi:hypothetical protein